MSATARNHLPFDVLLEEAERLWRLDWPNRNPGTYTAMKQIATYFPAARRNLAPRADR